MRSSWLALYLATALAAPCSADKRKLSADTRLDRLSKEYSLGGGNWAAYDATIAKWEKKRPRAGLAAVLGALRREAKEGCWEGSGKDSRAHSSFSFCWKDVPHSSEDDEDNKYWYPQGIASSGESRWGGLPAGKKVLAVTWYRRKDKDDTHSVGSRVSIVDVSDRGRVRYRNVFLVEPACFGCASWKVVAMHAGGVAWAGRYLYVADTSEGLRVFDLRRFLRHGNGFVLPQVAFYKEKGTSLKFSFASVEAGGDSLVTGEYKNGDDGARIVHWPLGRDGKLAASGGRVRSVKAFETKGALRNLQGVAVKGGRYYFTRSHSTRAGELIVGEPGERFHAYDEWSVGPEDLSVESDGSPIWGLTEHPSEGRSVYASGL